ncbi:MAG: glycosyltransferase family 4 protein [Saprospiraceae bacterium]
MRIAFLTNHFPPAIDGVGDYTCHLAAALARQGQSVHIFCRRQENVDTPAGTQVHAVAADWGWRSFRQVFRQIRQVRPDWVFVQYVPYGFQKHGLPLPLVWLLFCLKIRGLRAAVVFHEFFNGNGLRSPRHAPVAAAQFLIGKSLAALADRAVVSNDAVARQLRAGKTKTVRIPVGANFFPENTVRLPRKHGPARIVSIGGGAHRNRLLADVLALLVHRYGMANCDLVLAGKAETAFANQLRSRARLLGVEKNLTITGLLNAAEMGRLLESATILLLLDTVERGIGGLAPKSGAAAAAWAFGLPLLGARGSLTEPDYFRHGHNCCLAENDAESVAQACFDLLRDEPLRNKIAQNGHDFYRQYLAWERIAEAYIKSL